MNPFTAIIRYFRRRKLIRLEAKVAGLTAKLKRTEELAAKMQNIRMDLEAIKIVYELWEAKRTLQLLSEESPTTPKS